MKYKQYHQTHEDICDVSKWGPYKKYLGSTDGSLEELVSKFRGFYKESHLAIFDSTVKEIWLEQQITIGGLRRMKRVGNGIYGDLSFGKFTKIAVGTCHKVLTANFCFTPIASYLIDFFPEFLSSDPFKNPENYQYPYKHITLDFLVFVYQVDERLYLLAEAEKRSMSYVEFINWVNNWSLCHNNDIGKQKYQLIGGKINWPYIRNNELKKFWENSKFTFDVKK